MRCETSLLALHTTCIAKTDTTLHTTTTNNNNNNNTYKQRGYTALLGAAAQGRAKLTKELIARGADLGAQENVRL